MKLVVFSERGERIGLLRDGGSVADLAAADPDFPTDMTRLIALGQDGLAWIAAAAETAPDLPLASIALRAPVARPPKNIFCVGKNYREHAAEFQASGFDATSGGAAEPDAPIVFTKAHTSIAGPGNPIPSFLDDTGSVDYEGELAVIIGRGGRGIAAADAFDHVYGYTIVNDVTARHLQQRHKQWFLGKSIDGFCPMGPTLVTADEIADVTALRLVTHVNGETRQDASVGDLIFDIPTLIHTISRRTTLEPGDVIATGTPVGVGIGFDPPRFLQPGDLVEITIEPIGTLANPVA